MDVSLVYTDLLVSNLVLVATLSTELNDLIKSIDKNNSDVGGLINTIHTDILFHYAHGVNIHTKYSEAKIFALGLNKTPENAKERVLLNIRNILDYIYASYTNEKLSFSMMMHINKLFLDEIKDVWEINKLITTAGDLDSSFDIEEKKATITSDKVSEYIKSIEDFYYTSKSTEIIKAPLLYYSLSQINLFACGNDVVALALLYFISLKHGMSKYINMFKVINAVRHAQVIHDQELWLEIFFNELVKEITDVKAKFSTFSVNGNESEVKYVDLNIRQIKGLAYIKEKGKISREIYAKLNSISQITSYRDLNNMLQKGYVRVEGIGKGTKYIL